MATVREQVIKKGGSPRFIKKKAAPAPGEPTGRPKIGGVPDRSQKVLAAADKLTKARAAPKGKQRLAFLGFGKKKAEAAPKPEKEKGKGFVRKGREKAKEARRKKLIASGFTAEEAREMVP